MESRRNGPQLSSRHDDDDDECELLQGLSGEDDGLSITTTAAAAVATQSVISDDGM